VDSVSEGISDIENWLNSNGRLGNPNRRQDDCKAAKESDTVPDNGIEVPESPEPQIVSAAPNVPRLIQPTQRSKKRWKWDL